ncbi:hypothetical protein RclHR1_14590001 [Rhizophagus clarus]|uniref:RING-type domain-containing protein n=1 Tax=Rhizophagus clarus TaxID=94130 RepID=A0A2Z6QQD0_9GLOM|nr:hypothetical protein RclHR1_14590001 [Rhizophagus clarus]GES76174.1 hypothetical protein GLOIN_2v1486711 [Rhizophagus clarus]
MDKSHIKALAINIASKANTILLGSALPPPSENTNIDPCPICGNDIYTLELDIIKEFTLASCGHIFHQKCLEEYLVVGELSCPYNGCNRDIETFLSQDLLKGLQNQTSPKDVDNNDETLSEEFTNQKKRTRESSASTKKSSNKKVKKTGGKKVSSMLKKLIKELLTDIPVVGGISEESSCTTDARSIFLQLSDKIDNAKTKNEDASHDLISNYFNFGEALYNRYKELKPTYGKEGARALVKSEVRKEIPETKFSDDTLKKRMERARKMFRIFDTIGKKKITRVKLTPSGFILNLTVDDTNYVIAEILKGASSKGTT